MDDAERGTGEPNQGELTPEEAAELKTLLLYGMGAGHGLCPANGGRLPGQGHRPDQLHQDLAAVAEETGPPRVRGH
jgi:hypothetical protein